ncbi:hypothetical protein MUG94_17130 [Arthrobacter gengyunqii]|nr:hypothetical protein [Arthrobacter gengyunqii]UOY96223.1 hypothetical protein MUG94_17130 [Arthrobacter gengyunqii]
MPRQEPATLRYRPLTPGAEVAAYDLTLELINEGMRLADARDASLQW